MYRKASGAGATVTCVATFALAVLSTLGFDLESEAMYLGLATTTGGSVIRNIRDQYQPPRLKDGQALP